MEIFETLQSYRWYELVFELAIIWVCVYLIFRFLRGTRGEGVIKGVAVLVVALTLVIWLLAGRTDAFDRISYIYQRFIALLTILLIVVFQPELRQAMIRLGHAPFLRLSRREVSHVVDAVGDAVEFLSKSQFGALIAIERTVKLGGLIEGGEPLDACLSARLLESIFWPNSPLHDLGVVIRDDRIVAACVQFPLIEEGAISRRYGSRHRAAAGLSLETDCIIVIVSEETGSVGIAERGRIESEIPRAEFKARLAARLEASPRMPEAPELPEPAPDPEPAPEQPVMSGPAGVAADAESRVQG
jgi:diadenylate cyclase